VRIEVFSDVVCPWCFLAARRLRRALDELTALPEQDGGGAWAGEVEIRWRAFQLDPGARRGGTTLREVLERKYGPGAFDAMTARFATLGPPEGIDYRFDLARRAPTLDAHRLLAWAWESSGALGQGRLAEGLFSAYFEQGADIADHATLAGLAGSAGLNEAAAADVLVSGAFDGEVTADLAAAASLDIHAVPTMVVADGVAIPGAQETATLRSMLVRLHARMA
jgi:predicted DsbA family dithiol-disulfide isomerase